MNAPNGSPGTSIPPAIVDTNALTSALRTLKLGGMLQTLDARLHQARAGELGHLEFLQVISVDDIGTDTCGYFRAHLFHCNPCKTFFYKL